MRILVISETPWNTNNSFGNSFANIFDGMENIEIANLYFREGIVNDEKISMAYKCTAKMILRSFRNWHYIPGEETKIEKIPGDKNGWSLSERRVINFVRKYRFKIFYWIYYSIWYFGNWYNDNLKKFIDSFNPDLMFCPIYANAYMNRIVLKVNDYLKIPLCGYISDDNYTLHVFSLSPLYWIDRFLARRWVGRAAKRCDILYVISEIQKEEYDKIFSKNCHILTKGSNFHKEHPPINKQGPIIRLVYAGNIGSERWKSLSEIGKAIKRINRDEKKMKLDIYTGTPLTKSMKKALDIVDCVEIKGNIPYEEVLRQQALADILVHVEPTGFAYRLTAHHGFSTKLVDYMAAYRAVFAYGLSNQASIAHLKHFDAALIASDSEQTYVVFKNIIQNPGIINEYAEKAWCCGKEKHDINNIHEMLKNDFTYLL